jgi:hypothetical protein
MSDSSDIGTEWRLTLQVTRQLRLQAQLRSPSLVPLVMLQYSAGGSPT